MQPSALFIGMILLLLAAIVAVSLLLLGKIQNMYSDLKKAKQDYDNERFDNQLTSMNAQQLAEIQTVLRKTAKPLSTGALIMLGFGANAQTQAPVLTQSGILITIFLILIPIAMAIILFAIRVSKAARHYQNENNIKRAKKLVNYLKNLSPEEAEKYLATHKQAASYELTHSELSGSEPATDNKGLIAVKPDEGLPFVAVKKRAANRTPVDPQLSKLVLWYLITATFWLLFGTTIGEYVGIKFVAPDADHISWLSFGRLRPVHTNSVFWGWASLGMLGLAYYVVPRVGNTKLYSFKLGWYALYLINATVLLGTIALMAGINNGGGEYREYIWPIMALFGIGLVITLYNFLKTIARRATKEIYISNWYIVAAIMFGLTIAFVAYWPTWQNGLGETIIQGYYMHQGVGMWFMLFTLGLIYYYLPQHLNKPIYSYSLGILAFWTQILFYTLIGTHHFVFSSIPWWLQTVAIFGSVGMIIPVIAGTTNFLMTFKNGWYRLADSYTLPFFLVGTIFYFTGSMQGTAEAFRYTNLIWHFTDFTVAHSHLTMYGIICFFLWACIYTIVPRLTNREAPQITIGAHFWLALIGLLVYTIPLMYGSTLKGMAWMEGKPFIETVVNMAPHWLWRAIGGSFMWLSHIFFAYNLYKMMPVAPVTDVNEKVIEILKEEV